MFINLNDYGNYKNIFFISDLEFGRPEIIGLDRRSFSSVPEMGEEMVARWNAVVTENDLVVIVGDFCRDAVLANKTLQELKGHKILVIGNNDNYLQEEDFDKSLFDGIFDLLEFNVDGYSIILTHYPMQNWVSMTRGKIHIHGHVHGFPNGIDCVEQLGKSENRYNVNATGLNYKPVTLQELIKKYGYDKDAHSLEVFRPLDGLN